MRIRRGISGVTAPAASFPGFSSGMQRAQRFDGRDRWPVCTVVWPRLRASARIIFRAQRQRASSITAPPLCTVYGKMAHMSDESGNEVQSTIEEQKAEAKRRQTRGLMPPWKPGQSGYPNGPRNRKGKTTKRREIVLEAEAAAQTNRETSLQYLRGLMNDPEATLACRDRASETLARIEADILLRMEERARDGGLGEYDRCQTMAQLLTAIADDLRRSENRSGGAPDRCGLEHEDRLDLMFAFLDGDRSCMPGAGGCY